MNVDHGFVAAGLAVVAALACGALLLRSRREAERLRGRIETARQELENLQVSFSRFAPDEIIEGLIADGRENTGEKKEVSVLFADLVGFTALSESLEPAVLVRVLNGYFERMSRAISDNRGFVSTFIGDGLLAFFGALAPNPWQSDDALHAALAMRAALEDYNRELEAENLPRLSVGIGLNRGTGVMGLIGSRELKEFAFVGRAVNLAARVQDLSRRHDVDIIITEWVRPHIDPRFVLRALPPAHLKGVADAVEVFAVECHDGSQAKGPDVGSHD